MSQSRRQTIGAAEIDAAARLCPGAFADKPARRLLIAGFALLLCLAVALLFAHYGFTPGRLYGGLVSENGLLLILSQMFRWHDVSTWPFAALFAAMLQTVAIAFLGTLAAALIAVPLSFFGARNVVFLAPLRFGFRRLFDCLRGIDQLIWAVILVRAFGMGPMVGVLAIALSDIGSLAKLYAEAIETARKQEIEGVKATGASALLIGRFAILPQVLPLFVSQALYFFESNTRSATVIGIVGAGGIGLEISRRIKILAWDQVAFILLLIFATVVLIDAFSQIVRRRLQGATSKER